MAARVRSPRRGVGAVEIRGLTEFQRALRQIDRSLPRELRKVNKSAAEIVADAARTRAQSLGGVAAKSAPSIKATAEQRRAKVALGGARYPFALGANFGALHDVPRIGPSGRQFAGYNQFPQWGGNQFTGGANDRFLYWAISRKRDKFMGEYERLIDAFVDRLAD